MGILVQTNKLRVNLYVVAPVLHLVRVKDMRHTVRFTRCSMFLQMVALSFLVVGFSVPGVLAQSAIPVAVQTDAGRLDQLAALVEADTGSGDWASARRNWRAFGELWLDVEDGFRDASRQGYADIESAMVRVGDALRVAAPSAQILRQSLAGLRAELKPFVAGTVAADAPRGSAAAAGLDDLMDTLDAAIANVAQGNATAAAADLHRFSSLWLDVEGQVKTRSAAVYRSTEDGMGEARAMLAASPAKTAEAAQVLHRMRADLEPIAASPAHYGVADAAIILFREGLEALLVVAALVAFLAKSGARDKQVWVWGGAGLGVLVSVVGAFALQRVFTAATAGASRELIEGITGLLAAGLLLYVSYWLHSRASLSAWQTYIREKTSAAIAGGSLFSLGVISFLAVFREGAETVLFYFGIASAIETQDLALGLGLGTAGLVVIGLLILMFGVQIPMRPFFYVSSVLLYYLAFKFIGTGVHALQVSGLAPSTPAPIPSLDFLGIFPTWETTLPQLVLLAAAGLVVLLPRLRAPTAHPSLPTGTA
ncbi:MAG: iron permease [Chloroflexi bacterium]|nr:iron permease [Chloroflexota bacterium]